MSDWQDQCEVINANESLLGEGQGGELLRSDVPDADDFCTNWKEQSL